MSWYWWLVVWVALSVPLSAVLGRFIKFGHGPPRD